MKRTKLNKKSKATVRQLQDAIWQECRRIQLKKLANKKGEVDCYTCEAKNLQGSNRQLGHVPYPKSVLGTFMKYDLRLLKWQCMRCNIHGGGMGGTAFERMLKEEGEEFMAQIKKDMKIYAKPTDYYPQLLEIYKKIGV